MNRQYRLFYDGECPICRREMSWLKRRDRYDNLQLEDISAVDFDASRYGLTNEEVDRVLHGIRPDGAVVKGMDAVREAYRAVGLGWVLAPTRLPGVRSLSEFLYGRFARNRGALGRFLWPSCKDGRCAATPKG